MHPWKWYIYILECFDGTYYTGMTWNAAIRHDQHFSETGCAYTKKHPPKQLVYLEEHEQFEVARKRERQIKDWSRTKKKKLIEGKWGKTWD